MVITDREASFPLVYSPDSFLRKVGVVDVLERTPAHEFSSSSFFGYTTPSPSFFQSPSFWLGLALFFFFPPPKFNSLSFGFGRAFELSLTLPLRTLREAVDVQARKLLFMIPPLRSSCVFVYYIRAQVHPVLW